MSRINIAGCLEPCARCKSTMSYDQVRSGLTLFLSISGTSPELSKASKPGLKPGLRAFSCQKPGQSPLQARDLGRAGPGSNRPGLGRLWALGPARHITSCMCVPLLFDFSYPPVLEPVYGFSPLPPYPLPKRC